MTFAGHNITELAELPLSELVEVLRPYTEGTGAAAVLTQDLISRIDVLIELGLGYLSVDRESPTLSGGELQRLRLAGQLRSGLFGVVYILDEPSAGLHPADTAALTTVLGRLEDSGNSVFLVEHDLDVVRHADWLIDIGPGAGVHGGRVLYSGEVDGLRSVTGSVTRPYLFDEVARPPRADRSPNGTLELARGGGARIADAHVRARIGDRSGRARQFGPHRARAAQRWGRQLECFRERGHETEAGGVVADGDFALAGPAR